MESANRRQALKPRSHTTIHGRPIPALEAATYLDSMVEQGTKSLHSLLAQFVLEGVPEPVLILDAKGELVDANRAARESLNGTAFELFRAVNRKPPLTAFFESLDSTGRASLELDLPVRGALTTHQLALDGFAADQRYVVRLRDVTESRALERELSALRRGALTGLLAATVVHDFNNLLTPILEWTTRLSRELDRTSSAASLAVDLESVAERAVSLLRHARSLDQSHSAELVVIDLNQIVKQLRPLIERLFPANVKLELALDAAAGRVRVDRGRLEHALINLLVNARNALPGAGHVIISTRMIPVDYDDAARFVSLSVSDSGGGMTEEVRARAFEEFFTTGAASGGTGLGLASVRRFARESGGTVTLDSAPARGTTVTILLPRVGPESTQ